MAERRIAKILRVNALWFVALWFFNQNAVSQTYSSLPFNEDFEKTIWFSYNMPSAYCKVFPQGAWTNGNIQYNNYPEGANLSYLSARFPASIFYADSTGAMNLYIDLSKVSSIKYLSFWYKITSAYSPGGIKVFLSSDGGKSFGNYLFTDTFSVNYESDLYIATTGWIKKVISLGDISSSTAVIRFEVNGNINLDDIKIGTILSDFKADTTFGPAPLTVNFADSSKGEPLSWSWDFNNDGVSDADIRDPSFRYESAGIYPVKLIVSNPSDTDSQVLNDYIKVNGYASVPFYEGFENVWVNRDDYHDVPSMYWRNDPATGDNSWSQNWDGYFRGAWQNYKYAIDPGGANNSLRCGQFQSSYTNMSGKLDLYIDFSTTIGDKYLSFWYINNSGADSLKISLSYNGGSTFGPSLISLGVRETWTKFRIDLGSINTKGIIRFNAFGDAGTSDIGLDEVKIDNISADFDTDLTNGALPLTVHFKNMSSGTAISYRWDFNNDGQIDDTTANPVYVYSSVGTYSVKLIISNFASSDTIIKSKFIRVNAYASIPFSESFENSWIDRDGIHDIPSYYWKTNPNGGPIWMRNDYRTATGAFSPQAANGSGHSARCYSSCCYPGISNSLDLFVDFSKSPGNKYLSFWYVNTSGSDSLKVLLSTDGGITFGSPLIDIGLKLVWTKMIIDLSNVNASLGVIRFRASTSHETLSDIGLDEVNISDITSDFTADKLSGDSPLSVQFTDQSLGNPVSIQWDFDNDGRVDETARNPLHTFNAPGFYAVKLKVSKPGSPGDSVIKVNYIVVNAYSPLPFTENFENTWINRDCVRDVPSVNWKNDPASGNESWSRDDDGVAHGAWSDSIYDGSYHPAGAVGTFHSARFHSYSSSVDGNLDVFIDFSGETGAKRLSFWYNNLEGNDSLLIYLSDDGGKNFGRPLMFLSNTLEWTREILDLGDITASTGVIRFKRTGVKDGSDIGLDEIKIDDLVADFSSKVTNNDFPLKVQFTDHSSGNPNTWKWDFNNDGIIDATSQNPAYTFNSLQTYSVKLVVSNGLSIDSVIKTNAINAYSPLPFYEDFENSWINRDDIRDVPSIYWKNTPAKGDNSWSRDDDGLARGAWSQGFNSGSNGAGGSLHSASFSAFGNTEHKNGILDLRINFSSDARNKILSFRYLNYPETSQHTPSLQVTNTLRIYFSPDGGATFKKFSSFGPVLVDWTKMVLNLGDANTSEGVIRFDASNYTWPCTNIFIDDVKIVSEVPVLYASLPFTENFGEQWNVDGSLNKVPSEYWSNPTGSWYHNEMAAIYSAGRIPSLLSTGNLDLHIDFSTSAGNKSLSFDENIVKGPLIVKLSKNGGVSFEEVYNSGNDTTQASKNVIVDLGIIDSPEGVIRFEGLPESVYRQESDFSISNLKISVSDKNVENKDKVLINVFPVISDGTINVEFINFENGKLSYEIFNLNGKVVLSGSTYNYSDDTAIQLDLTHFVSGLYYIRTTCNGKSYLKKIIKR